MKCTEDQVPRFRGSQGYLDCRAIAHFTYKNDFGSLTQRCAEPVRVTVKVLAEFALVKGGFARWMDEFDWIFQRHNVHRLSFVNLIEQRRQGGGFAAASCARDQNQSGFFFRNFS